MYIHIYIYIYIYIYIFIYIHVYINKCPACMNGLGGEQAFEDGQLMGCTTNDRPGHSTHGIAPKHAYSILGMYDVPEIALQLIKVPLSISQEKIFSLKLSGNEVYYTA